MDIPPGNRSLRIPLGHQPDEMETMDNPGVAVPLWLRGDPAEDRKHLSPVRAYRSNPVSLVATDEVRNPTKEGKAPDAWPRQKAPAWVGGRYHPKTLTVAGVLALEHMGPDGDGFKGFPAESLPSIQAHRDMLAGRYVAWDLVARGLVKEIGGMYYHFSKNHIPDPRELRTRLNVPNSDFYLDPFEQMSWLALSRLMTLDQFIALDPENARNNIEVLLDLRDLKLVTSCPVPLGRGSLEVWHLTAKGWRLLRAEYIDMVSRGYGPRRRISRFEDRIITTCTQGRYALHSLLQVDALQWFTRDLTSQGHHVTEFLLERALMREAREAEENYFFDFQMAYEKSTGARGCFVVEVIGTGHSYRTSKRKAFLRSSPVYRTFSGASSHIELGWHVCIGR